MVLDTPPQSSASERLRHSAVEVRVVLFAIQNGEMWIALAPSGDGWALPSASLLSAESLDVAALRAIRERLGMEHRYIEQLYTVATEESSEPAVLIAYLGIAEVSNSDHGSPGARWKPIGGLPGLSDLDSKIVDYALVRLRAKLGYTTIAFHLLPMTFSLSELQQVYEIVLGRALDKRNFRRRIQSAEILDATDETRREGSHRPARLFRFRAAHDAETYLTPVWATATDGESGNQ